jgi:hypothetical protein
MLATFGCLAHCPNPRTLPQSNNQTVVERLHDVLIGMGLVVASQMLCDLQFKVAMRIRVERGCRLQDHGAISGANTARSRCNCGGGEKMLSAPRGQARQGVKRAKGSSAPRGQARQGVKRAKGSSAPRGQARQGVRGRSDFWPSAFHGRTWRG